MQAPVVVKLGGSAITDKSKTSTARLEVIHNAIKEIAYHSGQMVLLHGGGSFAHPFVSKAALRNGFKQKSQLASVSEIELNLDQLTRIIGVGLLLRHRPFVPLAPMSFMTLRRGPLLGEKIGTSRVLFGCDVDGLYNGNPKASSKAELIVEVNRSNYSQVLKGLKPTNGDVTGGMRGKAEEALRLAKHGYESYIFNLTKSGNLRSLLRGSSSIGTRFVPWRKVSQ